MRDHDKTVGHRDADRDGVPDHRDPVVRTAPAADPGITREVRRDAYERGRADERSRHKRNPILTILIAVAAVLGIAVTALAIREGSFSGAGRVVDEGLGQARTEAGELSREAADESGEALQDVGRQVEQRGEGQQGQERAPAAATPPAQ